MGKMKRFYKILSLFIAIAIIITANSSALAVTWVFGTSGTSRNPFTPRGYFVETDTGTYWLNSRYDNSSTVVKYTATYNGLEYVEAGDVKKLYAMTDRNPTPGKNYLSAYKDGKRISNFSSLIGTPGRASKLDPSGNGTCWAIPIDFEFEPGCYYEFAFLRGMQANNGITLVRSADGQGYIQAPMSAEEQAKYNNDRYDEYEYMASYSVTTNDDGTQYFYNFYEVPMRFSVQTYADMTEWNNAAENAKQFLNSVTSADYINGKYKKKNVDNLRSQLNLLQEQADTTVKKQLQAAADKSIEEMVEKLNAALELAKTDLPVEADKTQLNKKLVEANYLYEKAKDNTGTNIGEYGLAEVQALKNEIDTAKILGKYAEQSDVDAATSRLTGAIAAVKASLVREPDRIFFDKATGIYVIAPVDALPSDAQLFVERLADNSSTYKAMKANLDPSDSEAVLYKIQFYQNEYKIQPETEVEVQIPIPTHINEATTTLYTVSDSGKLAGISTIKAGGRHIFNTSELYMFAMVGASAADEEQQKQQEDPKENDQTIMNQIPDESDEEGTGEVLKPTQQPETEITQPDNDLNNSEDIEKPAISQDEISQAADPKYMIIIAAVIAVVAIGVGIYTIIKKKKEKNENTEDKEDK